MRSTYSAMTCLEHDMLAAKIPRIATCGRMAEQLQPLYFSGSDVEASI